MAGYSTPVSVHYTKQNASTSDSNRIAPAPNLTITPEIYYVNDNPVGYTYNITLSGYANSLRKELDAGSINYGMGEVLSHIDDIRDIFNFNGGDLHIKQTSGDVILAKGATIKTITFNPSDNKWINFAPFTIELEFNEINFKGCTTNETINCNSSIFHQISGSKNINNQLIDITQYKIKTFNDKWSFSTDEKLYDTYNNYNNQTFKASYTISATGKNYYVNNKLVPAWQQAKLFVQHRLRSQVMTLVNGTFQIDTDASCDASNDLQQILAVAPSGGIFKDFDTMNNGGSNWEVYNEHITCDTSESDGTFSITYNSLIKKGTTIDPSNGAAIHTFTKDTNIASQEKIDASITVKGTIQGLIRGGFIYYDFNHFQLPASGSFFTSLNGNETKYGNALTYYKNLIGHDTDLLDSFKDDLHITKSELLIKNDNGVKPKPSSFVLEHSYLPGTLNYTAVYNRDNAIASERGYANISIVRNDPTDIVQEFVIPGRVAGPIIQKLNMKTARTISINIDGASKDNKECLDSLASLCDHALPIFNIEGFSSLLEDRDDLIRTKEDYTSNKIDGSFSISLEYIAKG